MLTRHLPGVSNFLFEMSRRVSRMMPLMGTFEVEVPGTTLRIHCGVPLLLRADLSNFFPSISADRLLLIFRKLGLQPEVAAVLARFVTIDNCLPLGFNGSPMLANLVCVSLDEKITAVAKRYDCVYSRYADDIAISGKSALPSKILLADIVEEEGFRLSPHKFRVTKLGQAHYVTGLSVTDPTLPHAPRPLKRRLRQELYYCHKFGIKNHLGWISEESFRRGVNRLDGMVRYIAGIETSVSSRMQSQWSDLLRKDSLKPSYSSRMNQPFRQHTIYIDEAEIPRGVNTVLALAFVSTEEVSTIEISTNVVLREHRVDPFSAGRKIKLAKKGLHFADAHEELRTAYVRVLPNLPFRAFVIYGKLESQVAYVDLYCSLLKQLLPHRLMGCDAAEVDLVFEENPRISLESINQIVSDIYAELEQAGNRRPIQKPRVILGTKLRYSPLSVPDFLLGTFSDFARLEEQPTEVGRLRFERLRDKYRLILDYDTGTFYSRRRPFYPWVMRPRTDLGGS